MNLKLDIIVENILALLLGVGGVCLGLLCGKFSFLHYGFWLLPIAWLLVKIAKDKRIGLVHVFILLISRMTGYLAYLFRFLGIFTFKLFLVEIAKIVIVMLFGWFSNQFQKKTNIVLAITLFVLIFVLDFIL